MNFSATAVGVRCRRQKRKWRAGWLVGLFAFGGFLAHCQAALPVANISRREYRPDNVFAYPPKLSLDLRRVAVLPLAANSTGRDLPAGCAALDPVLHDQLIKSKKFEVVALDATALRRVTGRSSWSGEETLPADFFAILRREYACDAVLFGEVTVYHAYAPLAVGWRLKLVDARSGQIIWAADELFDSAQPAVFHAAQHFAESRPFWAFFRGDNWFAINSPYQFGRYSAAALLDTLPER